MQKSAGCLGLVVALYLVANHALETGRLPQEAIYLLPCLPAIPIALMMVVVGRYLTEETDEFVKMIVMHALLWGFGITLVADIIMGGLSAHFSPMGRLLPLLSIDLFFVATAIAVRIQLWRNR